ncbi:MAG: hypothetical protein ABF969_03540 [Sporolactobacillus sp.]
MKKGLSSTSIALARFFEITFVIVGMILLLFPHVTNYVLIESGAKSLIFIAAAFSVIIAISDAVCFIYGIESKKSIILLIACVGSIGIFKLNLFNPQNIQDGFSLLTISLIIATYILQEQVKDEAQPDPNFINGKFKMFLVDIRVNNFSLIGLAAFFFFGYMACRNAKGHFIFPVIASFIALLIIIQVVKYIHERTHKSIAKKLKHDLKIHFSFWRFWKSAYCEFSDREIFTGKEIVEISEGPFKLINKLFLVAIIADSIALSVWKDSSFLSFFGAVLVLGYVFKFDGCTTDLYIAEQAKLAHQERDQFHYYSDNPDVGKSEEFGFKKIYK